VVSSGIFNRSPGIPMAGLSRTDGKGMVRAGGKNRENSRADGRPGRWIDLSKPHWSGMELNWVSRVFEDGGMDAGDGMIARLERDFSNLAGSGALALSSGTAALHLALKLVGIGRSGGSSVTLPNGRWKGSPEVVAPTLTFVASCNPILYESAKPVFIDSERSSWNLDPQLLAEFLKRRARENRLPAAVMVVHLFGQSADMDPILEICARYELPVIEDAAEALGAKYKGQAAGTLGDAGVVSFNGNKIITGTMGGILITRNRAWVEKARYWSSQARDPGVNYLHSEIGYNYRMSHMAAAIIQAQLKVLNRRVEQRRAVFQRYREAFEELPGIEPQPEASPGRGCSVLPSLHTRWLSSFLIDERKFGMSQEQLIQFLAKAKVESRPVWKPMHTQKLYERYESVGGGVAEDLNRRGICLPSSSCLTEEEQRFVIERVREAGEMGRG
jgi:pyridoxal phosphate-dependent aminotransferase EpsN